VNLVDKVLLALIAIISTVTVGTFVALTFLLMRQ